MDEAILYDAGLTNSQAMAYIALVKNNPCTPPRLATLINESRTNTYKVLEQLEEFGLANRDDSQKKLRFWANNPSVLADRVKKQRLEIEAQERRLQSSMPSLMNEFFENSAQPGVRFYQGKEGLLDIYLDQIATKKPIYIIRPDYNMDAFDFDFMTEIRHKARRAGIKRFAITPDREMAPANFKVSDPFMLLERTWMKAGDYTAPVEWNAYGDKVAIMSFGEELVGTIIESPQIAESLRQLYGLLEEGLRRRPGYNKLPKHAKFIGATK